MDNLWNTILEKLSTQISQASYDTWFKDTTAKITNQTIIIHAQNSFARDWLASHFENNISQAVTEVTGKTYELTFVNTYNNEPFNILSNSSETQTTTNVYNKLTNLVKEQNKFLQDQQERIEILEKRINELEVKN